MSRSDGNVPSPLPTSDRGFSRLAELTDFLGLLAVLAGLCLLFGSLSQHFLTLDTVRSILNQVPDLMVVAVGMTLVLIVGGIDLSVGSLLALAGAILGRVMADAGYGVLAGAAAALAVGALCGLASGLVTVTWSIPSFIVTLGMLEIARGAAYLATNSQTKYVGTAIEVVARPIGSLGFLPPSSSPSASSCSASGCSPERFSAG